MPITRQRAVHWPLLVVFLTTTLSGFLYAVLRIRLPYVPMLQVGWLRYSSGLGDPAFARRYQQWASLLLERERAQGRRYTAVRVFWDTWLLSPNGRQALYAQRRRTLIAEYP
jgi:cytochrome b subunit of formate dehydrogenase